MNCKGIIGLYCSTSTVRSRAQKKLLEASSLADLLSYSRGQEVGGGLESKVQPETAAGGQLGRVADEDGARGTARTALLVRGRLLEGELRGEEEVGEVGMTLCP